MRSWLEGQDWKEVLLADSSSQKAELLQTMLVDSYHKSFPEKTQKINSDDQPWISFKLKALDRRQKREYSKHRKSDKWHQLDKDFKTNVKSAKKSFYKKIMGELTSKNTSKWYSTLKKMTSHDQQKSEKVIIQDINHLSDEEQVEKIAEHFSEIPNTYSQLNKQDISIEPFEKKQIPQLKEVQVWELLTKLNSNKSTVKGDLPAKLYK